MNEEIREKIRGSRTLSGPFPPFNTTEVPDHPHTLFLEWFSIALDYKVHEPHAMTLSTCDRDRLPDGRVLILKDIDERHWYFASSSNSRKGRQLYDNNHAALTFYWSEIGRQIRVRGSVEASDEKLSADDFLNRGKAARVIALMDKQSDVMENKEEFQQAFELSSRVINDDPEKVSASWTLYTLKPEEVEFWQASEDRNHIRVRYRSTGTGWERKVVALTTGTFLLEKRRTFSF
ncbi:pyridoxine/pyridoxamine 5'-phosphate oxidase [Salipaludibacillus aurantiacus]|uniref:Pyridoxamine 5'-phosphate oxidase n=1 Tax=Salipaludibacillus aurantiacus TaxID=1601833 RepID=A0A1H9W3D9_9BACI|nr:pyridoxal 5'-phosphate synthase [Salipaludibacillus aurantiacus]SES28378.1 pyridoxamine 5'-phosphate oxidase [Salipaludibacillus aurantiacus]